MNSFLEAVQHNDQTYSHADFFVKEEQTYKILTLSSKSRRIVKKIRELNLDFKVYKERKFQIEQKIQEQTPVIHLNKINNLKIDQVVQLCFDGFNQSFVQLPEDHEPQIIRLYEKNSLVSVLVNYQYIMALGLTVEQYVEASRQSTWNIMNLIELNDPQKEKWELEQDIFYEKITYNQPIKTIKPPQDQDSTIILEQFLNYTDPQKRNKYKNLRHCSYKPKMIQVIKIE